jgi:4-amino-4-deoxy-L-arabinose transferase-like glycosyltransferase
VSGGGDALRGVAARLALFVALAALTRAPFLTVPFLDLDEAAALVGSWTMLDGGTLYIDFVDNRPPLLYHLYALGQLVFGRGMLAVRLLTALVVLPLTALAASAFYRHDRRGLVAGVLYLVYGAAFLAHDMHSASAEVLMLLPLGWSVGLLPGEEEAGRPGRALAAGLLVGLAVLVRQHAVLWLPALAVVVWVARREERTSRRAIQVLMLLVGFSLPLAGCLGVFSALSAADELVYWAVTHNLGYAADPISLEEGLERAASYLLPFVIVTAPLWWAGWRSRPLFDSHHRRVLVTGLVVFSLPAAFIGFRFFPHYFVQLYLPLALAATPWTAYALRRPLSPGARVAMAWPLLALVGFTIANTVLYRGPVKAYEETLPVFERVATRLREDPCFERGPLFVWGFAPQLYTEARLPPASRFVVPQASLTGYVPGRRPRESGATDSAALVQGEHWDLLMQDLQRSPPAFVLDTSPAGLHGWDRYPLRDFPRLNAFVRSGYRAVADVDGVWIWRRRGCEGG